MIAVLIVPIPGSKDTPVGVGWQTEEKKIKRQKAKMSEAGGAPGWGGISANCKEPVV